jgi:hypothetical protein
MLTVFADYFCFQIKTEDGSEQADISAIIKMGSKIGVHSYSNLFGEQLNTRPAQELQQDSSQATASLMTEVIDCFDELTSILWFLSVRDRLSAAWRRHRQWMQSVVQAEVLEHDRPEASRD